MARISPPKVVEPPVPVITVEQLRALIGACKGKDFDPIHGEAIIRLFADTPDEAGGNGRPESF